MQINILTGNINGRVLKKSWKSLSKICRFGYRHEQLDYVLTTSGKPSNQTSYIIYNCFLRQRFIYYVELLNMISCIFSLDIIFEKYMVHIFWYDNYDNNCEICSKIRSSTYLSTRTFLANPLANFFFNIGLFTDIFLSRVKVNNDFDVFLFAWKAFPYRLSLSSNKITRIRAC